MHVCALKACYISNSLIEVFDFGFAGGSQYEEGMKALSEMDRVQQVEAIQGYNSMKSNLMDYLKTFAESGKTVSKEDIQQFFQQMTAAKRRRVEIPKFCK